MLAQSFTAAAGFRASGGAVMSAGSELFDAPQPAQHIGRQRAGILRALAAVMLMVIFTAVAPTAFAATFHAVIIGQTSDPNIGASVNADVGMSIDFANGVGQHFDDSNVRVLTGTEATPARVRAEISRLGIGIDDFLFIYYSGHGDTSRREGSPWPWLAIGIEGYDLLTEARKLVAPRKLVVFDACNGTQQMPTRRKPASGGDFQPAQVARLIKSLKGDVVVTSSKAPFASYADVNGRGSRFSVEFFSIMADVLGSPVSDIGWGEILNKAVWQTENVGSKKQTPHFGLTGQ